jgi:hypothetical protein
MTEHTPTPKLVMGHIEVTGVPGVRVPYDEAVIHLEGDEDSEIEIHCPGALRLAPVIVRAVNRDHHFDELVKALSDLYAVVKGECPSLLNEDSGGDARLDLEIQGVLALAGGARHD